MDIKELEVMRISLQNIKDELIKKKAAIKTGVEIYDFESYKNAPLEIRKWLSEIIKSMITKSTELVTGRDSSKTLNDNSNSDDSVSKTNAVTVNKNQSNEQGGISMTKRSSHFRSAPPSDKAA